MNPEKTIRALSLNGGGMRGLYSAAYLFSLVNIWSKKRGVDSLDLGKGFDLIAGTSTGAIIACALATGLDIREIVQLYQEFGKNIFPKKLSKFQIFTRGKHNKKGALVLERVLKAKFGEMTIGQVWNDRRIALAIPAITMSNHQGWVFKTQHLPSSHGRDNDYKLADVCLASTSAPIYRSLAYIPNPNEVGHRVFADGGLWANSPVLIALIDALAMASTDIDKIEIFCLGTSPKPSGENIRGDKVHRGFYDWKFGGGVVSLALNAQEYTFRHMARMLTDHINKECRIIDFPHGQIPDGMSKYLDLDETREEAAQALIVQAQTDANETLSKCSNDQDPDGQTLKRLLDNLSTISHKPPKT